MLRQTQSNSALSRKNVLRQAALMLGCLLFVSTASADSEPPLRPFVTASKSGQYYFKMVPDPTYDREKGKGACYEVREGELDRFLWPTTGWYSLQVFLSDDGQSLVRMGHWPRGKEPSKDDLAVAFYNKGELVKSYSTKDLIKDPLAVERTLSHYSWIKGEPVFKSTENHLVIFTTEKMRYTFDVTTGDIVESKDLHVKPPAPKEPESPEPQATEPASVAPAEPKTAPVSKKSKPKSKSKSKSKTTPKAPAEENQAPAHP